MLKFTEYCSEVYNTPYIFTEELHPEITASLDHESISPSYKLNHVAGTIRRLLKSGQETGLQDSKPKKGSSRAVFFPKEPMKVKIDGQEAHVPHVVKVAFPGQLDRHNKSGALLGEHQNLAESDHFTNHHFGILSPNHDGSFETNHDRGVLAPVLHSHEEGHHLSMGRIHPIKGGDFKELTKAPGFPKGISHKDFHEAMMLHHHDAHGSPFGYTPEKRAHLERIQEHPFVEKMHDFAATTGQHPGDMSPRNMGVWHHPVTGSRHIVLSDFGFTHDVAKHYSDARKNMAKAQRGW